MKTRDGKTPFVLSQVPFPRQRGLREAETPGNTRDAAKTVCTSGFTINSVSRERPARKLPERGNYIAAILHSVFPGSLFMQTAGIYDEKMYVYANRPHKHLFMFRGYP